MDSLRNSYLIVPLVAFITLLMVFLNSKSTGEPASKQTYIKCILFTTLLSFFVVSLNIEGGSFVADSGDIIKGPAPF